MTSFYTSLNGLKNAETDLGVIAHNIANAETTGFKKSSTQFADIISNGSAADPRLSVGIGATVSSIDQNFSLGAIEQTGRSLDLALDGDGFFAARNTENSEISFTRNGNLQVDGGGNVTDASGNRLQVFQTDTAGNVLNTASTIDATVPITNAGGSDLSSITVEKNGVVFAAYADGTSDAIGRVAVANFTAPNGLRSIGQTKWEATGVSGAPNYNLPGIGNAGQILSGALERSNVDLAEEMVSLITAQRNFQANAKAIDTATQISQTIINLRT
ncbi:flagellar hook-basal body protein [Parerythrobacter jejuensis]|uniref:Flagellar hook protein FlgE n=1 Tax=Parerythrobacter jejuensis TaxID=795812 RepID=A0A845AQ25_9SPHN|nr:flagellar hook basal-body protein [Parerythrobacter jejuensis]MXP30596.1 flagellar hook-basal body complex protein [Parerythrobacter jejuensis]MXP33356.1 flagellar hook-basal body complex protein [Parerythrobacter jejuensis]